MRAHQPMTFHLETERLTLRPWVESDADDYRELVAERGDGKPTVENIQQRIATQLAASSTNSVSSAPRSRRTTGASWCG